MSFSVVRRRFSSMLTDVPVLEGMGTVDELKDELIAYCDILLGREEPPIDHGVMTLMEVATAYYARALEMDQRIHDHEREGNVVKGDPYYQFRTGRLRSFIEMAKRQADLGSRRLTHETLLAGMQKDSGG